MLLAVACVALLGAARAVPVDNGVLGEPEIDCRSTSLVVNFRTQNNFEGHVYVKGLYDFEEAGCRTTWDGTGATAKLILPFDSCEMLRLRSSNPRGIFVRSTVVISFHPNFLTKVDRAYTLQCFYLEADKAVGTDVEVSMITTAFQTQTVPMPVCRYEILDAPEGNVIQFALIGQAVYHKWTCDSETIDTFCMYVYSCVVVDPAGQDQLELIDIFGCATDRYLMGNIEYPTDLGAIKEVHVFKYADRPALFFQCQIGISVKESFEPCARPICAEPEGAGDGNGRPSAAGTFSQGNRRSPFARSSSVNSRRGGGQRNKRSALLNAAQTIVDVGSGFEVLDVLGDPEVGVPDLAHRAPEPRHLSAPVTVSSGNDGGVCVSPVTAGVSVAFVLSLVVAVVTVALLKKDGKQ